jgi:hypothetical protein
MHTHYIVKALNCILRLNCVRNKKFRRFISIRGIFGFYSIAHTESLLLSLELSISSGNRFAGSVFIWSCPGADILESQPCLDGSKTSWALVLWSITIQAGRAETR